MMAMSPEILGFSNCWYPETVRTAMTVELRPGLRIRLVAPASFVATKLEAFANRGKGDYLVSHDLEDVLIVVDGRPELPAEMAEASAELRAAVRGHLLPLLADDNFVNALPGLIDSNSAQSDRWEVVMERLQQMIL